jgi:cell division septation protein DedD
VAVKVTPPRIKLAPAPVAVAPKPVAVAPKPAPKPTPRQIEYARQTACPQYDKVAQDHMILVNGFPVRCGPQAESPSGDVYGQRVVVAGGGAGSKIVAAPGTAPVAKSNVPAGYKMAWEDGRLNTKRGPISAQGDAQMAQVFEPGAVPMVPKGSRKVRVVAQAGAGDGGRIVAPPQFSVATKNDPKAARQPVAAAGRAWVQVGSFGVAANAAATAARLKAAGLPVAVTSVSRGGKSLQIVLAGPFASPGQVQAGLAAARSAGFKDAFVRN